MSWKKWKVKEGKRDQEGRRGMEQFVVLKGIIRGCLSKDKGSKGARWV